MKIRKRYAFTITEMLVVAGILVVLVALIMPSLSNSVKAGKQIQSTSNLRNIYVALALYAGGNTDEMESLPSQAIASDLIEGEIRCSPLDNWPTDCKTYSVEPVIGSYGYIRGIQSFQNYDRYKRYFENRQQVHTIMIDIFVSSKTSSFFQGDIPTSFDTNTYSQYLRPDKTLRLKSDGSIKLELEKSDNPRVYRLMSWASLFLRDLSDK